MKKLIQHLRDRVYMSGVERDKQRVKATGEVFTPTPLVQEMLDNLPQSVFKDKAKTFLDPTCGDGQFLSEVIIRKVKHGSTHKEALQTTYGADLMIDNCIACIKRLYMTDHVKTLEGDAIPKDWQRKGVTAVFKVPGFDNPVNIVCADGLRYDYSFGQRKKLGGLFA